MEMPLSHKEYLMTFEDLVTLYLEESNEYHAALNSFSESIDEDACEVHLTVVEVSKELDYAF